MAKVRYIGDPRDRFSGPQTMSMYGVDFEKGEYAEVTDKKALARLRGHSHFQFEGDEKPEDQTIENDGLPKMKVDELEALCQAEGASFEPGAKKAVLIEALRKRREEVGTPNPT